MARATTAMTPLSFPVLTKRDVVILSLLLVFASYLVSPSSADTTTDEECGKYCGKICGDLPSSEQDPCKVSLENCNCSSTPPAAIGPSGRRVTSYHSSSSSHSHYSSSSHGTRYRHTSYSSGGGDGSTVIFIFGGVFGFIFLIACIVGCVFLCSNSSSRSRTGRTQMYVPNQQIYQPVPNQPYGNGMYGSSYGTAAYY